jgi:hypothetical protein
VGSTQASLHVSSAWLSAVNTVGTEAFNILSRNTCITTPLLLTPPARLCLCSTAAAAMHMCNDNPRQIRLPKSEFMFGKMFQAPCTLRSCCVQICVPSHPWHQDMLLLQCLAAVLQHGLATSARNCTPFLLTVISCTTTSCALLVGEKGA